MSDLEKKNIESYLKKYIPRCNNNQAEDTRFFVYGMEIPQYTINQYEDYEIIDFEKQSYNHIKDSLEQKTLTDFIDYYSKIDNLLVISIADLGLGGFSGHLGLENQASEIHFYNPNTIYNTNDCIIKKGRFIKSENNKAPSNFKIHKDYFNENTFLNHLKYSSQENILIYSSRICSIVPTISKIFNLTQSTDKNVDFLIRPLANLPENETISFNDSDSTIDLINKNIRLRHKNGINKNHQNLIENISSTMNLYLCYKLKEKNNNIGFIYRELESKINQAYGNESNFKIHQPTHYFSSIKL
jgi:hypothetical protein